MTEQRYERPIPEHIRPVADALRAAPLGEISLPWKHIASLAVGGLEAIGFERTTENLLVASSSGQSVIDCKTGEKRYRNYEHDGYDWSALRGRALNSGDENWIEMCGLHGGGLRTVSDDGYSVRQIPLEWPICYFVLEHPKSSIYLQMPKFDLLLKDYEARSWGFSWTGKTLVWADGSGLHIWGRS
jgi:hypothetical protein